VAMPGTVVAIAVGVGRLEAPYLAAHRPVEVVLEPRRHRALNVGNGALTYLR